MESIKTEITIETSYPKKGTKLVKKKEKVGFRLDGHSVTSGQVIAERPIYVFRLTKLEEFR